MLLRWSGHRLGTWLVKEQRVSLGSAWGGIIQLLKQTDPSFLKCLFSPHAFCIVEIVVGPRRGCGAAGSRMQGRTMGQSLCKRPPAFVFIVIHSAITERSRLSHSLRCAGQHLCDIIRAAGYIISDFNT